jgi:NTE family protein
MATTRRAPAVSQVAAQPAVPSIAAPVVVDLALQGGGSHGAFTWGVLDRLLEDGTLEFGGVSGTSAGALNAGVLATGLAAGGRAGARAALSAFWLDVASQGACFGNASPAAPWAWPLTLQMGQGLAGYNLDLNPAYAWFNEFLRRWSPYQFNPYDLNPLRDVARRHVDEAALRDGALQLFITATAVRTGQPRVFSGADLSIDALLASACLPQVFRAVVIEGEPYWDGGYSGNPAIWPLIYNTAPMDIVLVKINALVRSELPDTPLEIADRVNEITFNAGLVAEMRAIDFVQRLIAQGHLDGGEYKSLRLHMVADDDGLAPLHASSKMNTDRRFLEALRDLGRAAATRWLAAHRQDVGVRSSMDISDTFLAQRAVPRP